MTRLETIAETDIAAENQLEELERRVDECQRDGHRGPMQEAYHAGKQTYVQCGYCAIVTEKRQ